MIFKADKEKPTGAEITPSLAEDLKNIGPPNSSSARHSKSSDISTKNPTKRNHNTRADFSSDKHLKPYDGNADNELFLSKNGGESNDASFGKPEELSNSTGETTENLIDSESGLTFRTNRPERRVVKKDIICWEDHGDYIIEPIRRPKNKRHLAAIATLLIIVMLTGSLFFYGNAIGVGTVSAASHNFKNTKKTGVGGGNSHSSVKAITVDAHPVILKAIAVERDMNVRINDTEGYPIAGYQFVLKIVDPEGNEVIQTDLDRDGRIYLEDIPGGDYAVSMEPFDGFSTPDPIEVNVPDKVAFQKIEDIEDKIANASEIVASADDPQYGDSGNNTAGTPEPVPVEPESTPTPDTVEFVESRTETIDVTKYKGNIGENGRLYANDGTLTNIIPVVEDGYLTGDYTIYEPPLPTPESSETPSPSPSNEPVESESTEPPAIGGDINLFEADSAGNYIYDVTPEIESVIQYYGWQDIDDSRYYFTKNATKVTGTQVIQGISYTFADDGKLLDQISTESPPPVSGTQLGIDISTWQNHIDWNKVKDSGISFAMIRIGFRGYGTGKLVEDDLFYTNLVGAKAAGIKVGVYFFSQAVNEREAVEEASMVVSLLNRYGYGLEYPVAFDSEYSGAPGNTGRADSLSRSERTACAVAFCETIRNSGYSAMVYASKSWFESNLNVGSFGSYTIWLAHYTPGGERSSYSGRYEMWQYTSRGTVNGIAGNVDLNYGYLNY